MNTDSIPDGWWLNVTIMARFPDSWIVGVIRRGKASWITEHVLGNFDTAEEAYGAGMEWIGEYLNRK
jgi:hypothetical protein